MIFRPCSAFTFEYRVELLVGATWIVDGSYHVDDLPKARKRLQKLKDNGNKTARIVRLGCEIVE